MSTLRLITGGIGTGKSLWTVDKLFDLKKDQEDRKVYTDITGIQHTGIISVAPDFDWRDAEDNSLIVFDEVQYKDLFSRHNSKRDKQILDLTTIRKRGIELWIITQRARFLNPDVLGLVNEHVHLEKNSKKSSKVFHFLEAETSITKAKKMFAFKKYVYQYPEHLYGFYESIKDGAVHHTRSWLHTGIVTVIITLIIAFIGIGITIYNASKTGISATGVEQPKDSEKRALTQQQLDNKVATNSGAIDCEDLKNSHIEQCVSYNKEKSKRLNEEVKAATSYYVDYDPLDPYASKVDVQRIQVNDFPRLTNCVKWKNTYIGIDQQGNKMLDVKQDTCKRMIENAERPFDYFKDKNNQGQTAQNGSYLDQENKQSL